MQINGATRTSLAQVSFVSLHLLQFLFSLYLIGRYHEEYRNARSHGYGKVLRVQCEALNKLLKAMLIDSLIELPENDISILDFICLALLLVFAIGFDFAFCEENNVNYQ